MLRREPLGCGEGQWVGGVIGEWFSEGPNPPLATLATLATQVTLAKLAQRET